MHSLAPARFCRSTSSNRQGRNSRSRSGAHSDEGRLVPGAAHRHQHQHRFPYLVADRRVNSDRHWSRGTKSLIELRRADLLSYVLSLLEGGLTHQREPRRLLRAELDRPSPKTRVRRAARSASRLKSRPMSKRRLAPSLTGTMMRTEPLPPRAAASSRDTAGSAAGSAIRRCKPKPGLLRQAVERLEALDRHARHVVAGAAVELDRHQPAGARLGRALETRRTARRRTRSPHIGPLASERVAIM